LMLIDIHRSSGGLQRLSRLFIKNS
jgi:hypothetical protein